MHVAGRPDAEYKCSSPPCKLARRTAGPPEKSAANQQAGWGRTRCRGSKSSRTRSPVRNSGSSAASAARRATLGSRTFASSEAGKEWRSKGWSASGKGRAGPSAPASSRTGRRPPVSSGAISRSRKLSLRRVSSGSATPGVRARAPFRTLCRCGWETPMSEARPRSVNSPPATRRRTSITRSACI